MKMVMQNAENSAQLDVPVFDLCIIGNVLDDRGNAATAYLKANSKDSLRINYLPDNFQIEYNDSVIDADDFAQVLQGYQDKNIILECTTLGFVEILLCCKNILKTLSTKLSFLYVEPKFYRQKPKNNVFHRRDFDLSEASHGYEGIPGYSILLQDDVKSNVVFFAGFEAARIDSALEDFQMIDPKLCSIIFGVPAFRAGWEIDSFSNNIEIIEKRGISGDIKYCGAADPLSTYLVLKEIEASINEDEQFVIAPIGTKPAGIAVALFATLNENINLLYDHPKNDMKRTTEVSNWHLYEAFIK